MSKNEITKQPATMQEYQALVVNELSTTMQSMGCELSPYGKKCALNSVAGAISFLKGQGKTLKDVNATLFKLSIQSAALLELNYASVPSEIYFDLRGDVLTIKTQGAGNEKLVRRYGVGIAKDGLKTPWLVREGDEFTYPSYNGLEITPPTWKPKSYSNKVILIVYPVQKSDGSVEYLISSRDDVAHNLVAQIRQNSLYSFTKKDRDGKTIWNQKTHRQEIDEAARQKFYDSLNDRTLDDLLSDETLKEYINPTYMSSGSKEQMIIRKMKNNALKNYPREYDNSLMRDAVENLYEDKDESLNQPKKKYIDDVDITKKVDDEIEQDPQVANAPQDFKIDDDGVIQETKTETEPQAEPVKVEVKSETNDSDYGF